jgi:hypothetical protein
MVVFLRPLGTEKMRYPNTRYGNPEELRYYSQGMSIKELAKQLKRSEKSIKQWLSFEKKVPYWVPELLRLRHMEKDLVMRQMGFGEQRLKLGIVRGDVIDFQLSKERSRDKRTSALRTASALPIPAEPAMECS